jgi:hypothetical protein
MYYYRKKYWTLVLWLEYILHTKFKGCFIWQKKILYIFIFLQLKCNFYGFIKWNNIFNIKSSDKFSNFVRVNYLSWSLGSSIDCYDDYLKYINIK